MITSFLGRKFASLNAVKVQEIPQIRKVRTSKSKRVVLTSLKNELRLAGLTHRETADRLGKSFEHVNLVLNGHRISARLVEEIKTLIAKEVASAQ